ncbi:hypothetical protein GCM10008967_31190 [Bacillus carboniphilus]|uniref:Peptidyl-prolyl cis-trans isomerase n=1 Tax=Bacillus carboniphilus TaxID=86663 RepID=A0ABP3G7Q1_9BACI
MDLIIPLKGNVQFPLTLDPSVWIFDDRKIDLEEGLTNSENSKETIDFSEVLSKNWEKEIMEGAVSPPTIKTEKKFQKEKILTGTFGMKLKPFLETAEPSESAKEVVIETTEGEVSVSLKDAFDLILLFSIKGKPLKEDGPVHVIYGNGSNVNNPIKHVRSLTVR